MSIMFDKLMLNCNGVGNGGGNSEIPDKVQTPPTTTATTDKNVNMVRRRFSVTCVTYPGESVCVTGDCDQLGSWKHGSAFLLDRISSSPTEDSDYSNSNGFNGSVSSTGSEGVWSGEICLPADRAVKYRYFVCMVLENPNLVPGNPILYIMRRWESADVPRLLEKVEPSEPHRFGFIGSSASVEQGWLTAESIVQFKLSNSPLRFWRSKHQAGKIRMKMLALNLERNSSSEFPEPNSVDGQSITSTSMNPRANDSWPLIEYAVIDDTEYAFQLQSQFGRTYSPSEILIFQAQVLQLENVAYMIDFYMDNAHHDDEPPVHIGFCHILPVNLKSSIGSIIQPITGLRQESIGQCTIEYLVVRPLENSPCNLSVSYSRHWKWNKWTGLDIGHRGSGISQKKLQQCSNIRENTIASLQKAAAHGADFVEFDVQLSKDLVPVLFHDFHVLIALNRKKRPIGQAGKLDGLLTNLRLPMHTLTVAQLHELRISHEEDEEQEPGGGAAAEAEEDIDEPFPTLESALHQVSIYAGFNIEVKWPLKLKDGSFELENPVELNTFLDIVLQTVLVHGGKRRIVFSCFHPDICIMIRLKQNKYPVLFLTQGVTSKYPEYNDPRTQTTTVAINFALFAGILGLNMHTEDILRDPNFVQRAKDCGLVVFCWGEDNNSSGTIKYLKQLGLHGVVYDRIDEHMEQKQSIFLTTDEDNEFLQIASGLPLLSSTPSMEDPNTSSSTP